MADLYGNLIKNIRRFMVENDVKTVRKLSEMAHTDYAGLNRFFNGQQDIKLAVLYRIASCLNTTVSKLTHKGHKNDGI